MESMQSLFSQTLFPQNEFSYNPWHGCVRKSEGCANCFIYTIDSFHDKDTKTLYKTRSFALPLEKRRDKSYKIPPNSLLWTCFSSDFLIKGADLWRDEVWKMMKIRADCTFIFFTKRIERLESALPSDWGEGYENVIIGCSVENQQRANERLPLFLSLPIRHRHIIAAPLLEKLDLSAFLGDKIALVSVGGESGLRARVCDYEWVLSLRKQCLKANVKFHFHQTGANFKKDNRIYALKKPLQRSQAKKAGIDIS